MTIKTILLFLDEADRAAEITRAGAILARPLDAHLIGLQLVAPHEARAAGSGGTKREELSQNAGNATPLTIKTAFERVARDSQVEGGWRAVPTADGARASMVLAHGFAADLLIARRLDTEGGAGNYSDITEELVLGSGGPVLLLPPNGRLEAVPSTITVSWSGTRECARALHDALPLLRLADRVNILRVGETSPRREVEIDCELIAGLARHDVEARVDRIEESDFGTVGEAIRSYALETESNLLVMGAYGHSRLRQLAFGGVTRHMLRTMSIPVLFSH